MEWSLAQAIANIGCGYHVVPSEAQVKAQVAALRDHLAILPKVLQRFRDLAVLNDDASKSLTAPQGQPVAGLWLEHLFEEEIAPVRPAQEAFWRMHAKLMSAGVAQFELDGEHGRVPDGVIKTPKAEDAAKFRELITEALRDTIVMLRPLHAILQENPDNRSRKLVRAVLTAALEHKFSVRKTARSALRHLRETAAVAREYREELEAMERYFEEVV